MRTTITSEELSEMYDDYLNDTVTPFRVGDMTYQPAYVLEQVDPIAYRCGYSDYYDIISDEYICKEIK
jgi:hypothetical protein